MQARKWRPGSGDCSRAAAAAAGQQWPGDFGQSAAADVERETDAVGTEPNARETAEGNGTEKRSRESMVRLTKETC